MSSAPTIRYTLSVLAPEQHLVAVELRLAGLGGIPQLELEMAAWCPGSYLVRDYARFVRGVSARDAAGNAVAICKTSKQAWSLHYPDGSECKALDEVIVQYQVYGRELTVRTNHIDESHAFLHGPAVYLYAPAWRDQPHHVRMVAPEGRDWHVATGLSRTVAGYRAAGLDELLDCPVHMGEVDVRSFEVRGAPVELVVWGSFDGQGVADLDQLAADTRDIVEAHAARFGGVPFGTYTFLLMLAPGAYGGLEHRNSSANLNDPQAMRTRSGYEDLLELLSHEFFHVWNGKRIFPEGLTPFDYSREQYTRCLWVMEGLTSYCDRYTLRAAGKIRVGRFFEKLAEEWARLQMTPGRFVHSLEESSFDAWIKLYKAHESNANTTVSYYLKGGLVSLALDFEIRRRTDGKRSLDDVLRALWADYGAKSRPYPEDVQALFEAAAGISLERFFETLVRGHDDPDLAAELAHAGLEVRQRFDKKQLESSGGLNGDGSSRAEAGVPAWLGLHVDKSGLVAVVLDASPAAVAGFSPGDEIVALGRRQCKGSTALRQRLSLCRPGEAVELALFRRGTLQLVSVTLGESPPTRIEIAPVAAPTVAQCEFYLAWIGEKHPGAGAHGSAEAADSSDGQTNVIGGATMSRFI